MYELALNMFPREFMHNKTISPLQKVRNTYAAIYSFQDRDLGFSSLLSAFVEGAGQRACTVPTSTTTLYMQYSTNVQPAQDLRLRPCSGAFNPSRERRRDFPRRFVKLWGQYSRTGSLLPTPL